MGRNNLRASNTGLGLRDAVPDRRQAFGGSCEPQTMFLQSRDTVVFRRPRDETVEGPRPERTRHQGGATCDRDQRDNGAKKLPEREPVGARILVQEIVRGKTVLGPQFRWGIVGIVKDEKVGNLNDRGTTPACTPRMSKSPVFLSVLIVRADMDPLRLQQAITDTVRQVNKDQTLTDMKT